MRVGSGLWALDRGEGMTALNLLDALVSRLKELFAGYELQAKSGLLQTVKVFAQYLPQPSSPEVNDDETDSITEPQGYTTDDIENNFPCVIVKVDEMTDKEEGTLDATRINVRILAGIYDESPDCQGYRDVMNIIEVVRQDLLTMPARVLAKRYRLEMPLKSYVFEDQPWPIYFGQIESTWETGRPLMPKNFN